MTRPSSCGSSPRATPPNATPPGLGPTDHPVAEAVTNNSMPGQPWAAGGGAGATYWRLP